MVFYYILKSICLFECYVSLNDEYIDYMEQFYATQHFEMGFISMYSKVYVLPLLVYML